MIQKINIENSSFYHRHTSDVERIKKVLLANGYDSTLEDCSNLWDDYSYSLAAGWINLPDDDDELFRIISYYI